MISAEYSWPPRSFRAASVSWLHLVLGRRIDGERVREDRYEDAVARPRLIVIERPPAEQRTDRLSLLLRACLQIAVVCGTPSRRPTPRGRGSDWSLRRIHQQVLNGGVRRIR